MSEEDGRTRGWTRRLVIAPIDACAPTHSATLIRCSESAMTVFATSGVDAPVREIAEKAGVGVGTVYRHFPQRSDLIVAVFRREVDACADAARSWRAEHEPGEALARWMQRYVDFICRKTRTGRSSAFGRPGIRHFACLLPKATPARTPELARSSRRRGRSAPRRRTRRLINGGRAPQFAGWRWRSRARPALSSSTLGRSTVRRAPMRRSFSSSNPATPGRDRCLSDIAFSLRAFLPSVGDVGSSRSVFREAHDRPGPASS